jgi:diadenosine tetraphosphate (Ap4A) HIT family hydrolase
MLRCRRLAAQSRMADCLFCRIVQGTEPASVVESTSTTMTLLDLHGVREGHALVIPRRHVAHTGSLTSNERAALFEAVVRVQQAQRAAGLNASGHTLLVNDGPEAGQHIPHVHVHVVPRARGDTLAVIGRFVLSTLDYFGRPRSRDRLDGVAARLRAHLPATDTSAQ